MPVGMTILARAAGQERMGRVMALVGVPMLLAPRSARSSAARCRRRVVAVIFFVNLPVAALALVLAARVLPREATAAASLDVRGPRCSRRGWWRWSPASPRPPAAAGTPLARVASS